MIGYIKGMWDLRTRSFFHALWCILCGKNYQNMLIYEYMFQYYGGWKKVVGGRCPCWTYDVINVRMLREGFLGVVQWPYSFHYQISFIYQKYYNRLIIQFLIVSYNLTFPIYASIFFEKKNPLILILIL